MFRILCIFAMWIGWFGHQLIRGKSIAPSIFSMMDVIKRIDNMGKKKSTKEVIREFQCVHGNTYDYSLITNYKNNATKVPIICNKCKRNIKRITLWVGFWSIRNSILKAFTLICKCFFNAGKEIYNAVSF